MEKNGAHHNVNPISRRSKGDIFSFRSPQMLEKFSLLLLLSKVLCQHFSLLNYSGVVSFPFETSIFLCCDCGKIPFVVQNSICRM